MFTIPSIGGWSQIKNHNSKSKIVLEFGRRVPMSIRDLCRIRAHPTSGRVRVRVRPPPRVRVRVRPPPRVRVRVRPPPGIRVRVRVRA